MKKLRHLFIGLILSCLALSLTLVTASCKNQTATSTTEAPGTIRTFTGKWSATGNHETMQLESGHEAVIFRLTGSLLLEGNQRLKKGFKADVIGFKDTLKGLQGRSVWTDERGDKVFSELHREPGVTSTLITGKFLGGTGRFTDITGEYTFNWKRFIYNDNGKVSGRVVDLKGWAQLGSSTTSANTKGAQQ